jgi:hypothetical protein
VVDCVGLVWTAAGRRRVRRRGQLTVSAGRSSSRADGSSAGQDRARQSRAAGDVPCPSVVAMVVLGEDV